MTEKLVYSTATPVLAMELPKVVPSTVASSTPSVPQTLASKTSITVTEVEELVAKYATPLGVSQKSMLATIGCETPKNPDGTYNPAGQSLHVKNGVRENSWGIVQIHLPSHPTVSKEQAQDPEFAVKWMAEAFSRGDAKFWSCWNMLQK